MYYFIEAEINTPNGIMLGFLATDHKFYSATNSILKFLSPSEASKYWREHNELPCNGSIHIRGPRGCCYPITCWKCDSSGTLALLNNPSVNPIN